MDLVHGESMDPGSMFCTFPFYVYIKNLSEKTFFQDIHHSRNSETERFNVVL